MVGSQQLEAQAPDSHHKRGGWITFPFIAATVACMMLSGWGWLTNLIVYLIEEFNVKSIRSTQIYNVVNGFANLIPIIAAIVADSFLGSFPVVAVSTCFSVLGLVLMTLTASINKLRPLSCEAGSSLCQSATGPQFAVLYTSIALATIGFGGTKFTLATLGANQLEIPKDQSIFFDWFFFSSYFACVVSSIVIVYVETSISWALGFGLCAAANFVGLAVFFIGNRFYVHDKPQGSPFGDLARVIVATARKWHFQLSSKGEDYFHGDCRTTNSIPEAPKSSFRFLNRAALKTEGDIRTDGSIAKPWRLCTVQQVEDFKVLVRILPLWSSTLFLSTPIAIQQSMAVLQALAMDRHLGHNFKIPAGSLAVIVLLSTSIFLTILDRLIFPAWEKLTSKLVTPLQRIGVGHIFNMLSMVLSALVELKRLRLAHSKSLQEHPGATVPMSVCWLFPQLAVVGMAEALHFPAQVSLYYQEFPASLKSTATAMFAGIIGICFYTSTGIVGLIRNVTTWLPDDINNGRLDCMYWTLVLIGFLNFVYYLVCAWLYKYQNVKKEADIKEAKL